MKLSHLPIDDVLPEFLDALRAHASVVLQAPAGAGKTTRVPPAIVDSGLVEGRVLVLEPRRLAARAVARRMADERGCALGDEVGYQVRYDARVSKATTIQVVTEGILTRRIQHDPLLDGVGCVVLDEFHERSIHTDLALAFLREAQILRDDLKIVVMSATLGADRVSAFLDAPVVTSEGRTFPLTISNVARDPEVLADGVVDGVRQLVDSPDDDGGDILVFLPGAREIRDAVSSLQRASFASDFDIRPLYGALPPEEQDRAIEAGPRRKVVVSTNIAETSLTIEGVTAVVDSGLVKRLYASASSGFDELRTELVSDASATQRAGRAGRTAPGRAVRLWSKHREFRMTDFDVPDVARVDVTSAVLEVIAWSQNDPRDFDWFEPPPPARLGRAMELLTDIGAVERDGWQLTERGKALLDLPLHPRLGAVLLAGKARGCPATMARVCAILAEGDFVSGVDADVPPARSDLLVRAEILERVARGDVGPARRQGLSVNIPRARNAWRAAQQLARFVDVSPARRENVEQAQMLKAAAAGFPDRICLKRADSWAVSGGDKVVLGRESLVRDDEVIVALEIFGTTRRGEGIVRQASALDMAWLEELFPGAISAEVDVVFDTSSEKVQAVKRRTFHGLPLHEAPGSLAGHEAEAARVLAEAAATDVVRAFRLNADDEGWLERLRFLKGLDVGLDLIDPDFEDRTQLEQICWGKRSFGELRRVNLVEGLLAYMPPNARSEIERLAPAKLQVPSGSRIRLDYSGDIPVLAVRMQEIFGWTETPRVGGGRVPVLLHLLAPNYRPAQVTQDLASFWATTYADVRKELRARYPKHPWPEDPYSAKAVRK